MKKFLLKAFLPVAVLFLTSTSKAQTTGIYESYAILSINGAANTYYDMGAATANPDFQGSNLGNFTSSNSLVIKGGQNKTFKCGGGDVTGGSIYYRVWLTSSGASGAFSSVGMGFISNDAGGCGGNQTWEGTSGTTNVLTGLPAGNYTLEVYSDAPGSPSTAFANNGGANYRATFNYCGPTSGALPVGNYAIPGCFPSVAAAVTYINTNGVSGTGTVQFDVASGYTETAPSGGISITATGTATTAIVFKKSGTGANPTITAPLWTAGGLTDGIIKIIGGDYITIDGFTILENPANTVVATGATNTMTEVGIGLYLATATNGAQNNTIQNCSITLSSAFPNTVGIFSSSSSSSTNGTLAASATTGTNSNNKIYSNTISNVAYGLYSICEPITATINESGWDVGGTSVATGNTITFGNATTSTIGWNRFAPSSIGALVFRNGVGMNIRFNTITSNNLSYPQTNFGGVLISNGASPVGVTYTTTISNNTITLSNSGTTAITAIDFAYGLSTGTIVANNNVISINSGSTAANAGVMYGIKASYASNTNTINGNTITYNQSGSGTWTGGLYYIAADGSSNTMTIQNNNLLSTGGHIKTTGTIYGITHNGAIATSLTVGDVGNGNTINYTASGTSGSRYGIYTNSSTAVSVTNYKVSNNSITISGLAGTSTAIGINNTDGGQPVKIFDNNTINISGTNTGATAGYTLNYGNVTVSNSNITVSNAATSIMGINYTSTSLTGATANANTINITSSAITPTLYGINSSATTITNGFTITNNNITGISASGSSTNAPVVSGIRVSLGSTNTISGNTISGISTGSGSGSGTINGLELAGGTTNNVFKNKVYNVATSCSGISTLVSGIKISGGTTNNVYNNLVGILNASTAASIDAIRGINIVATSTSTQNIFHNSVYLNATSAGANFGTTGIYHTTSATATVSSLNLRNNIVINNSVPSGTGLVVAYRRSSSTLTNYASTSDNNLFYAGSPSATNLIFYDGTNSDQTLAAFKTRMSTRDQASQTENVSFQSTIGSDANFLRIAAGTTSYAESGAVLITTPNINTDYWGITRPFTSPVNGGTSVDIGASEFDGIPSLVNCVAPVDQATAYVAGAVTSNTAAATFTAAASTPTGYLVIGSQGAFTGSPVDGTVYTAGASLGNGAVIQSSASTSINATGLPSNTVGTITIYSYNSGSCVGGPKYNLVTPLVGTNTTCAGAPTVPLTTTITGTGFTTNWTANVGGNAFPLTYIVEVTTDAAYATPITGSPFTTTAASLAISGLSPQTNYYWRVKANNTICDSAYLNAGLVTTECVAVTTFPSVEPFATYLPSTCWKEGDLGDLTAGPTTIGSAVSDWISDDYLNNVANGLSAKMNIDTASGSEWIISPYYTIPTTGYRVKYNVGATQFGATTALTTAWEADDFVELLVSTSNTNWTVLKTYNSSNVPSNLGQLDNSDLSAYSGQTVHFAFRAFEGASNGSADIDFFVDNFTVEVAPIAISASASVNPICSGDSTTLSVSSANTNYAYTWSPATGLSATTGSSVTANPTTTTTYTINAVDGSMANSTTITVTVNPAPSAITVTPATVTVCQDEITTLVATGGTTITTGTIGNGTTAPGTTSYPNPLSAYYGGTKQQMIFTAAELTSLGLTAGTSINSVGLFLNTFVASACTDLTIRMKATASTALTGIEAGTSTVYGPTTFTPSAVGQVSFALTSPFVWNGTSNIIVEFVHNAGNTGNGSGTTTRTTTTTGNLTFTVAKDNVTGGIAGFDAATGMSISTGSTSRPNVQFGFQNQAPITWSPQTGLYTDAAANTAYTGQNLTTVYHKGASNTYVATATLGSCPKTASATITVNPTITTTFTQVAPICSGDTFTLPTTSLEGVTGTWSPAINTTATTAYAFTPTTGQCATTAAMTVNVGGTSTWSGSPAVWSPAVPTSIDAAVISANYTESATLNACSLTVNNNAVVTIPSGTNVNLQGAINVVSGSFALANTANLNQVRDINNSGNISVTCTTTPLKRLDYVLWSAPVTGQQLQSFSPGTLSNRFYTYNPSTDFYDVIASPSTTNFNEGTGYLIRVPNNHPTTATPLSRTFTGVPNNGDLSISVTSGTWNAIGNPYPSTIDADEFITANNLTDPLYFWRKDNAAAGTAYATYTLAGGAGTASNVTGTTMIPDGTIAVGQGFLAKATSTTFSLTNAMRNGDTSAQFFRASTADRSRVWLNLFKNELFVNQTMVAYMPSATNAVDSAIDGRFFENNIATQLSSVINGEKYAVQGRAPFMASDIVSLGFKAEIEGNYSIGIDHLDGIFANGQEVFLKDNLTNTVHNLSNGNYNFASAAGNFDTRFEMVYQSTLATENPVLSENTVIVYKKNQDIVVNAGSIKMKNVQIYDIQGRLLVEQKDINATITKLEVGTANQVLIVKVTSNDNVVVTKKLINY